MNITFVIQGEGAKAGSPRVGTPWHKFSTLLLTQLKGLGPFLKMLYNLLAHPNESESPGVGTRDISNFRNSPAESMPQPRMRTST